MLKNISEDMAIKEIHCRKCGLLFHACKNSIADKSQLCGNCAYVKCPECKHKFTIVTLDLKGLKCPYCNFDLSGVFDP